MKYAWIGLVFAIAIAEVSPAKAQQPFQNVQPSPTVSPYLNLLNNRGGTGLPAYQTLVRPQIEQQQENQRQQTQISRLARQDKGLGAGGLTRPARGISNEIRGTGHDTGFMTYGTYFPRPQISMNDPITRRLVTMDYRQ